LWITTEHVALDADGLSSAAGRPFHDIDKLRTGDLVVVETKTAYSVYAVQRHEIVKPTDVGVIAPVPDQPGVTATGLPADSCDGRRSQRVRPLTSAVRRSATSLFAAAGASSDEALGG
jgi:hypothetical protein